MGRGGTGQGSFSFSGHAGIFIFHFMDRGDLGHIDGNAVELIFPSGGLNPYLFSAVIDDIQLPVGMDDDGNGGGARKALAELPV